MSFLHKNQTDKLANPMMLRDLPFSRQDGKEGEGHRGAGLCEDSGGVGEAAGDRGLPQAATPF